MQTFRKSEEEQQKVPTIWFDQISAETALSSVPWSPNHFQNPT